MSIPSSIPGLMDPLNEQGLAPDVWPPAHWAPSDPLLAIGGAPPVDPAVATPTPLGAISDGTVPAAETPLGLMAQDTTLTTGGPTGAFGLGTSSQLDQPPQPPWMEQGPPPPAPPPEPVFGGPSPDATLEAPDTEAPPEALPEWMGEVRKDVAEVDRQGGLTDEQFAMEDADRERRRKLVEEASKETALLADNQRARDNEAAFKNGKAAADTEMADIRNQLKELSEKGVDPGHWMESRNTGQKIAAFFSAISGGFMRMGSNGQNPGLNMIMGAIDQDIEAQKANLSHQRGVLSDKAGLVGQLYNVNGDAYRAAETARVAMLEGYEQRALAEASKYDPRGTAAAEQMKTAKAIRKAKEAAAAKLEEATNKRHVEDQKLKLDQDKLAEDVRHSKKAEKLQGWSIGSENQRAKAGRDAGMLEKGYVPDAKSPGGYRFDEELAARMRAQDPEAAGKVADAEQKQLSLEQAKRADVILDGEGKSVGKPIDATKAQGTREKVEAHGNLRRELGKLNDLIAKRPTEGKYLDRWKSKNRAAVEQQRKLVANTFAKIVDPVGAVSDKTIVAAMDVLPDVDGYTENRHPRETYRLLTQQADGKIEEHARGNIVGYVPGSLTRKFQDSDKVVGAAGHEAPAHSVTYQDVIIPFSAMALTPENRAASLEEKKRKIGLAASQMTEGEYSAARASLGSDEGLTPDEVQELQAELDDAYETPKEAGERFLGND